ncbi:MAG: pyridoxamine 5'-phosphate oxidase family protein [Euryarchaeota archaeon]|nr:pyridoxamine 5'-phosphate oxidase family protein [Euryarchaeota archaeon]
MQKKEREITARHTLHEILIQGKYATISLCRENEPYVVTLSYGYDEKKNALYFHTALKGLKLEIIRQNPRACGTVIEDRGYLEGRCAHAYRSVVFQGKMRIVQNLEEKKHAMSVLLNHLEEDPEPIKERNLRKDEAYDNIGILRLDIEEITGKKGE